MSWILANHSTSSHLALSSALLWLAGSTSAIRVGPCAAFRYHHFGCFKRTRGEPEEPVTQLTTKASSPGCWPICQPSFSLCSNSPHHGPLSPAVCNRDSEGRGKKRKQGTEGKRVTKERRRT